MNTGHQKKGTVIPENRKQMHLVSGEVYSTLHKEGEPKQSLEVSPAEEIGESPGRKKQLEFTEQHTREKTAAQ